MRSTTKDVTDRRPSRVSRVAVILSTIGVAVIAAWVFVPILLANYAASIPAAPKSRNVAQQPVIVPPPAPVVATPAPAVAPTLDETTASVPPPALAAAAPARSEPPSLPSWPADAAVEAAADTGATHLAATAPAEPAEAVPLPRKRPRLAIAARLGVPLPRPRPEAETDGPAAEQSAFERQVERMR
jgi:hypothetical protein